MLGEASTSLGLFDAATIHVVEQRGPLRRRGRIGAGAGEAGHERDGFDLRVVHAVRMRVFGDQRNIGRGRQIESGFGALLTQDRIHAAEASRKCEREPTSHVVANMESMFVSGATLHALRSCANGLRFHRVPCILRSRGPGLSSATRTAVRACGLLSGPAKGTDLGK